jgi:hypothetical protein
MTKTPTDFQAGMLLGFVYGWTAGIVVALVFG